MTTTITPEIAQFARAVRDALADLPAEERDELTEGLEADLAEAYAEDLRRELPDPDEYATELRNAAGLPKSDAAETGGMVAALAVSARRTRAELAGVVRRNPGLASVAEFLVAVRPLWWVTRAWVAAWLVAAMIGLESGLLPSAAPSWLVLGIFVVISVQWGRGRWRFAGLGPIIVLGNVIAAVLLLPVAAMADSFGSEAGYAYVDSGPSDLTGVYLDGTQVTNVFPYDAQGKPLSDVQLFDQDGRQLSTSVPGGNGCLDESTCETFGLWAPRVLSNGLSAFNVYPMRMVPADGDVLDGVTAAPNAAPVDKPRPFETAPKVAPNNE